MYKRQPNRGAVYIHYLNSNGSVKSTVKITGDTTNGPDLDKAKGMYGSSVENIGDLDGDGVNDMAVGEIQGKGQNTYRGALHIHFMNTDGSIKSTQEINTGSPTQNVNGWLPAAEAPWSASEPWVNAKPNYYTTFGSAITSVGDHDGDGVNDLAVGAQLDGYGCDCDGDGNWDYNMGTGAVYILHMKTDGTVKSSIRIDDNIPNGSTISSYPGNSYGGFGTSITWADLDNDYTPELIVGAASDKKDNEHSNLLEGAVYIITWNGGKKFPIVELNESISLTDAITIHPTIELTETLSLTDVNFGELGKAHIFFLETMSFTDVVTIPEKDITQFISETASLSDSVLINFHLYNPTITESVSLTDATTGVIEYKPVIYDTIRITKDSDGARQGFGMGMASLGDLDGNGAMDLAIGASSGDRWYTSPDTNPWSTSKYGAVYITYMNTDGTIKSTVTIDKDTANGPGSSAAHSYGKSIANLGDLDGDGVVDIAVGANWQDSAKGAVYIHFLNANGSVKSTATIKDGVTNAPDLAAGDHYGSDIANMGDLDDDGVIDIAVGADHDSSNGNDKGAVYIHYLNSDGSLKEDTVKIRHGTTNGPDIHSNGGYGNSVENIGDIDGDGVNDLAVGESSEGSQSGRGYLQIHLMNADQSIKSTTEIDPYNASHMPGDKASGYYTFFGSAIQNIGDHNNDGVNDIAVGASMMGYYDENNTYVGKMGKGSVFILHMKNDGSVKESFRIDENFSNGPDLYKKGCCDRGGQFGASIAAADINGSKKLDLIVGAPSDPTAGSDEGAIWIIHEHNGAKYLVEYTQAISETLTLTDIVNKKSGVSLSETLSLSDSTTGTMSITLPESISFTDAVTAEIIKIGAIETLTLTDTVTVSAKDVTQYLSETLQLTDSIVIVHFDYETGVQVNLMEHLSFTDKVTSDIITSIIKITEDTTNAPSLDNRQGFGAGLETLGDLDGDGVVDFAVGATKADKAWSSNWGSSSTPYGAVFIMFMKSDGSIKSTVTIDRDTTNGPGSAAMNGYGSEIANLGDLDGDGVVDIAVGDRGYGDNSAGAVYIHYMNTDGSVKSTVKIDKDTPNFELGGPGDRYGSDIANMGDLDGDGVIDIAVGAEEYNGYGDDKGAVYIHYLNSDASIKSTVQIRHGTENGPDIYSRGMYGNSVENIGDLDGDGVVDLAVGEVQGKGDNTYSGALHIHFMNTDGSIKSTQEINTGNPTSNVNGWAPAADAPWSASEPWVNAKPDYYTSWGSSITSVGDQDGDGVNDLAVGASLDGYGCDCDGDGSRDYQMGTGAVYILNMKTDGTVKSSVRIDDNIPNGSAISSYGSQWHGGFGSSLTWADLDGDYIPELIVGAAHDKETATRDGAIYIITWNGGSDYPVVELTESISLTDAVTINPTIELSESLSLTDVNFVGLGKVHLFLSESISFTDTTSFAEKDITQFISETVTLSDSILINFYLSNPSISESVSLTDAVNGVIERAPVIGETIRLTKDTDGSRQGFGTGMTSLGDLDGDGVVDLAVGAAASDKGYYAADTSFWATDRNGAVYIMYMNADNTVKSTVTIDKDTTNVPSSTATASYGRAIENLGDIDGDGVIDIAVGADWQDSQSGAVYIHFLNANGSVKSTATIKDGVTNAPDLTAGDRYGTDIANMGDLDGDGVCLLYTSPSPRD